MVHLTTYGSYRLCSAYALAEEDIGGLIQKFNQPFCPSGSALSGRSSVEAVTLSNIGPVIIKYYTRGGILRYINKKWYLNLGNHRCRLEYEWMVKARSLGILTPEPVAYAYQGYWFYRGWLITREICGHQTLADLSLKDASRTERALEKLTALIDLLIDNRILHVDLHPGNVLVNEAGEVYLIDFDKSRAYLGGKDRLRDRYINRWSRAIVKHNLPDMLGKKVRESFAPKIINPSMD